MQKIFLYTLVLSLSSLGLVNAKEIEMTSSNLSYRKEIQMNHENHTPQYLYKIVSPEEWQESLLKKQVVTSPFDKNFIHLATESQLDHVAQKFWKGKRYIILKLDSKRMTGRLIYKPILEALLNITTFMKVKFPLMLL